LHQTAQLGTGSAWVTCTGTYREGDGGVHTAISSSYKMNA